jgi:hypothetical protein
MAQRTRRAEDSPRAENKTRAALAHGAQTSSIPSHCSSMGAMCASFEDAGAAVPSGRRLEARGEAPGGTPFLTIFTSTTTAAAANAGSCLIATVETCAGICAGPMAAAAAYPPLSGRSVDIAGNADGVGFHLTREQVSSEAISCIARNACCPCVLQVACPACTRGEARGGGGGGTNARAVGMTDAVVPHAATDKDHKSSTHRSAGRREGTGHQGALSPLFWLGLRRLLGLLPSRFPQQ